MIQRFLPTSPRPPVPGALRKAALVVSWVLSLSAAAWTRPGQLPVPLLDSYDLSSGAGKAEKLPKVLDEVSGLATTADGRLFGHGDERAIVYQIDPDDGEVLKAFTVGPRGLSGDFEGIAISGLRFFLSTSAGEIVEFREGEAGSAVGYRIHSLGLQNQCEMEGLAYDEDTSSLLMPCKTPRTRNLQGHLVVFSVPLGTMRPDPAPRILIPLEALATLGLDPEFHPSAIEVHPETRSLILVAAREEAMVELSPSGDLLAVRKLKKKDHPQPEGISFLLDDSLVLADEGQGERGTVTRYAKREEGGGRDR
jgi:uncharacterized protein YjiK